MSCHDLFTIIFFYIAGGQIGTIVNVRKNVIVNFAWLQKTGKIIAFGWINIIQFHDNNMITFGFRKQCINKKKISPHAEEDIVRGSSLMVYKLKPQGAHYFIFKAYNKILYSLEKRNLEKMFKNNNFFNGVYLMLGK